MAPCWSH